MCEPCCHVQGVGPVLVENSFVSADGEGDPAPGPGGSPLRVLVPDGVTRKQSRVATAPFPSSCFSPGTPLHRASISAVSPCALSLTYAGAVLLASCIYFICLCNILGNPVPFVLTVLLLVLMT